MSVARSSGVGRREVASPALELDETWLYLKQAYQELRRRRTVLLRELDLSWSEYIELQICAGTPASPSEIADAAGVTSAGATDIIDRLEGRRWVRRQTHPKDRRSVLVGLTRAGERGFRESQTLQRATARQISGALSASERESLGVGLRALLRAIQSSAE